MHRQTHRLGTTIDWLISNTANIIQDITKKDYISDHTTSLNGNFKLAKKKPTEKMKKNSRRDLTKTNEENFNIDLKKNLKQ